MNEIDRETEKDLRGSAMIGELQSSTLFTR